MTDLYRQRRSRIEIILKSCRKQRLTFETPALADKVHWIIRNTFPTLCAATIKDYSRSIIDVLKEKK